jgi:hypothetical protein
MRARNATLILTLLIAIRLPAQTCTMNMSPLQCYHQFLAFTPPADAPAAANKTLATMNTGTTSVVAANSSSLRDFLALFAASVESATLKEGSNALTLDWNLPVPILGDGRPLKLQAVVTKPDLNSELVKKLGTNADAISALRGGLPESGDLTLSASIDRVSRSFGRAMGPHRKVLEAALNTAEDEVAAEAGGADDLLAPAIGAAGLTDQDANRTFQASENAAKTLCDAKVDAKAKQDCIDKAHKKFVGALAAIQAVGVVQKARSDALINNAINPFVRLLNNQPQFYFSLITHSRDKLVGPNETSGKLTYEMPLAKNLNDLYASAPQCTPATITQADEAKCGKRLQALAETLAADPSTANQNRLSIAAEYHEVAKTDINLTQYTATLQKPGSHSFTGSLTYGYALDLMGNVASNAVKSDRIDISLSYENVSGDPLRRDRGVGSITFTKKLNDTMTIPISLLYANHAQYLSPVDRKLNVHFGLVFKLPK